MNDFLVIGGGIAGISAGARLSALGRVAVLEAEDGLGYHASGRSAALFEENYGTPATVALNRASRTYHMEANGGVLTPRGLLLLGSRDTADAFAHDFVEMKLSPLSVDDAIGMVPILNPDKLTQAGYHADAWDIDTDRLIQNFAREIRGNQGAVHMGARVKSISRTGAGWAVETGNGVHEGRILFNAAGAWVDEIAAMAGVAPIGFTPFRRSIARLPAPGGHDVSGWPMIFGAGESWYAKPDAGKLLVSPADEDPAKPHDAWPDDMVLAEGLARFEENMTEPVTRLETSWAGLRTFSPDRSFVIGPEPDENAFFWIAGQGGCGMQSSPAASQLVADMISGAKNDLVVQLQDAVSPARFR